MGFEDDIDEYISENIFYIPLKARWEFISKKTYSEENGYTIDNAMKLIEDDNPQLKGIFSKNFGNPEIDKKHLGELIDLFNNISFNDYYPNERFWSNIFETCLYRFFQAEGKKSSESYTPIGIIKVLVNILKPNAGRVMTLVVVLEECLYNLINSLKIKIFLSKIFLFMVRK